MSQPNRQYLLIVLAEEGAEVAQASTKCLRFGFDHNEPGYGVNSERLAKEVGDLLGIVDALGLEHNLIAEARASKIERVKKHIKDREQRHQEPPEEGDHL